MLYPVLDKIKGNVLAKKGSKSSRVSDPTPAASLIDGQEEMEPEAVHNSLSICKMEYNEEDESVIKTEEMEMDENCSNDNEEEGEWSIIEGVKGEPGEDVGQDGDNPLEHDPLGEGDVIRIENVLESADSETEETEAFLPSFVGSSSNFGPSGSKYTKRYGQQRTISGTQSQPSRPRRKLAVLSPDRTSRTTILTNTTTTSPTVMEEGSSRPAASPSATELQFECHICQYVAKNKSNLTRHIRSHTRITEETLWPRRYTCPLCVNSKATSHPTSWWAHMMKSHLSDLIRCESCEQHFINRTTFDAHNIVMHGNGVRCSICEKTVSDKSRFFDHLLYHHSATSKIGIEKPFNTCTTCGRCFKQPDGLKQHLKVHLANRVGRTCEFCPKTFLSKKPLITHLAEHHETNSELEKKYKCKYSNCERRFASTITLARHEYNHKRYDPMGKTLRCEICELSFLPEEQDKLLQHIQDYHEKKLRKTLSCLVEGCNYRPPGGSWGAIKKHERKAHSELLIHECKLCDKKYSTTQLLETHMITHSTEGPFKCCVCNKATFVSGQALSIHLAQHNGEDTFKCEQCPGTHFYELSALKFHMISEHDAEVCDVCGRKFYLKRKLKEHKAMFHPAKDAPTFQCSVCARVFNTKIQRTHHIRRCHSGRKKKQEPKFCEICGQKAKDIRLHQLRFHNRDELEKAKKHICYFCSKTFYLFFELNLHMSLHTLEKPYICHVCHKDFTQNHCLNSHLKIHKKDGTFFPKPTDPSDSAAHDHDPLRSLTGGSISDAKFSTRKSRRKSLSVHECKVSPEQKSQENTSYPQNMQQYSTTFPSGSSTSSAAFYEPHSQFRTLPQLHTAQMPYPPPIAYPNFLPYLNPRYHSQNPTAPHDQYQQQGYHQPAPVDPPDGMNFDMLLH